MNKLYGHYCKQCGIDIDNDNNDDSICIQCFNNVMMSQYYSYVVVTREMAMDAGDMSLEGQRIKW